MPANTYGRQVVLAMTNKSGGGVIAGDVVIVDTTNNDAFTTTTSAGFTGGVGIATGTIANNAVGLVLVSGYASLVNVNASVTRGNFGKTHTVAKQATDAGATRGTGTFCQFLTGGTTPDALVYPVDLLGSSLTNPMTTKGDIIVADTGGTPTRLQVGATAGYALVSAGAAAFPVYAYVPGTTRVEYTLSGDVTMTNSGTFYDGPSGTPAAGTYDVMGYITFQTNQTNDDQFVCRIVNGSTVIDERMSPEMGTSGNGDLSGANILSARATMNGSDTLKITAASVARNGSKMIRDPASLSSTLHRATLLVAVRVA